MIYLFRKNNGQIALTQGAAAWEMYTSNGSWKYKPVFLGGVEDQVLKDMKEMVLAEVPISEELILRVNHGDKAGDNELRKLNAKRKAMEDHLMADIEKVADKSKTPPNMDIVNKDALPKEYHAMARNLGNHE